MLLMVPQVVGSTGVFSLSGVTFQSSDTLVARVLSWASTGNYDQQFEARILGVGEGVANIAVTSSRADEVSWELAVVSGPFR